MSKISAKKHDWKSSKLKTTTTKFLKAALSTSSSLPKKLWEEVALPIKYHQKINCDYYSSKKKVYLII